MGRSYGAVAQVLEVVDGDTFHAVLDIGWGVHLWPRSPKDGNSRGAGTVRVLFPDGKPYDAPEISTREGKLARSFISQLVLPGETLDIVSFRLDDFGRTLAAVNLPAYGDWATLMTQHGYVK